MSCVGLSLVWLPRRLSFICLPTSCLISFPSSPKKRKKETRREDPVRLSTTKKQLKRNESWKVDRVLANQSLFHDRGYTGHFQHSHCLVYKRIDHRQARVLFSGGDAFVSSLWESHNQEETNVVRIPQELVFRDSQSLKKNRGNLSSCNRQYEPRQVGAYWFVRLAVVF